MRINNKQRVLLFSGFLVSLIFLFLFFGVSEEIEDSFVPIDLFFSNNFASLPYLTSIMEFVTFFGDWHFLLIFSILISYLIYKRDRFSSYVFLSMVFLSMVLTFLLKQFYVRLRPVSSVFFVGSYSFPSGHALIGMSFYGLLAYFSYRYLEGFKRTFVLIFSLLLAVLVGVSRIFLNVHWASDVIGGFLLALSILSLTLAILEGRRIGCLC